MKLSIITATYNSQEFIGDCIGSISNQGYPNIEHLIIDGVSTDNTLETIRELPNRVTAIVSEEDNGIYDAMNKGIQLSSGDVIGILNSDDFYSSDEILEKVMYTFHKTGCDAVFGNLDFVDASNTNKVIRHWKTGRFENGSFAKGWHPPHPTFFVRREVYEKYGLFDTELNVSADFELMLRFLEKHEINVQYIDETLVKMRYGGESTGSIRRIIEGNKNVMKAFRKNNIHVSKIYTIKRIGSKVLQFINR